jgi:hypothetical protein
MARQQLGVAPANNLDAATVAFVLANKGSGGSNVYVQQNNPNMTSPGVWYQIDASGNLVTVWVETASSTAALPAANLAQRWRAKSITASNGSLIDTLTFETSGMTLVANSTQRATYLASGVNGQPGLTFDGVNNGYVLGTNGLTIALPYTIFVFANLKSTTNQAQLLSAGAEILTNVGGGVGYQAYAGTLLTAGTGPNTGMQMMSFSNNAGTGILNVNGSQVATGSVGTQTIYGNKFDFGWLSGNGRNFLGDIYEIAIYSANMFDASQASNLSAIKTYATQTYGITMTG